MDDLIQQAAQQLGFSAEMVERSARARAAADGTSIEAVLTSWLGGEVPAPAAVPAAAEAASAAAPAAPAEPPAPAEPAGPVVEVLGPGGEAESAEAEDEPGAEVAEEPEPEEPVKKPAVPRWLAASFVIIPLLALTYALFNPNGPSCGDGAVLAIDPVTGESVNCDGSPYGVDQVDFVAMGQSLYSANCAACHGANGAGGGLFPGFTEGAVLVTFPPQQCEAHVEWITLGTLGWPTATYGANNTAVGGSGGVMPGFSSLSEEELRAVSLYERVAFGGQPRDEAAVDCGLLTPEGEPMLAAGG